MYIRRKDLGVDADTNAALLPIEFIIVHKNSACFTVQEYTNTDESDGK